MQVYQLTVATMMLYNNPPQNSVAQNSTYSHESALLTHVPATYELQSHVAKGLDTRKS